jgi:hypothetical protein
MRTVCAWCGTTVTEGEAGDTTVSHGICPQCSRRYFSAGYRYAVLPRQRSFLFPEIESALRAVRGIRVILDRRWSERRRRRAGVRDERRAPRGDRRHAPGLIVGAVPAVGGLFLVYGRSLVLELPATPPLPDKDANGQAAVRRALFSEGPPGLPPESRARTARPGAQRALVT